MYVLAELWDYLVLSANRWSVIYVCYLLPSLSEMTDEDVMVSRDQGDGPDRDAILEAIFYCRVSMVMFAPLEFLHITDVHCREIG